MFRNELFSALEIVNRGDIELDRLRGSWAGALGQPQFMPSTYLKFSQDFDGDGRRDIWTSLRTSSRRRVLSSRARVVGGDDLGPGGQGAEGVAQGRRRRAAPRDRAAAPSAR